MPEEPSVVLGNLEDAEKYLGEIGPLTLVVKKEGTQLSVVCQEYGVAAQGSTLSEALGAFQITMSAQILLDVKNDGKAMKESVVSFQVPETVSRLLSLLPSEKRLDVIEDYCPWCGEPEPCFC